MSDDNTKDKEEAIRKGYVWSCACGELYKTEEKAWACWNCIKNILDYKNRENPKKENEK